MTIEIDLLAVARIAGIAVACLGGLVALVSICAPMLSSNISRAEERDRRADGLPADWPDREDVDQVDLSPKAAA